MTMLQDLTAKELLKMASIKGRIEHLQAQLGAITGDGVSPAKGRGKRRRMSRAGRARIAAAQRARWAKVRGVKAHMRPKRRRKVSVAVRAKLAAAAKARWAKAKDQGKSRL